MGRLNQRKLALANSFLEFATYFQGISTLLLLLSMLARVDAQAQRSEVQALLSFKAANTAITVDYVNSGWTKIDNSGGRWSTWKETDENACAWVGVTCTTNFTVEKLDLSASGLNQLHASSLALLSKLTDLRELDLSFNNLGDGGAIPREIETLTRLTVLDLSRNNFSGNIPSNISSSPTLQYISFAKNHLTGEIPSTLRDFKNLQVLLLADNQLTGEIPTEVGALRSILTLDLSRNMLSGSIPPLSNLTNLVDLKLDNNLLTDFIGELPSSETLEQLSVSRNRLVGRIPLSIGNLVNLKFLDMSYNNLSGAIPYNLSASLQYICLEQNRLTGDIPVDGLVNLQLLLLANNQLTGSFNAGGIDSLSVIDMSSNLLSGVIPDLANFSNLVNLSLDNNYFSSYVDRFRDHFPLNLSVEYLGVSRNLLHGQISPDTPYLVNLKVFDMSNNFVDRNIPSGFSQLMNKSFSLDLSFNNFMGSIPPDLFRPLENGHTVSINLSNNNLTGSIQFDGAEQHNYILLDLSENNLSGPIPSFGNNTSTRITSLRLHNNLLSGDLVDFFANNPGLFLSKELRLNDNFFSGDLSRMVSVNITFSPTTEVIDLSNNFLQMVTTEEAPNPLKVLLHAFNGGALKEFRAGRNNFSEIHLPQDLGNFSTLEVLDLSNDYLKREILDTTFNSTWFPALQFLNLSNNDFSGLVPQSIVLLPSLATLDLANNNLSGPLPAIEPNSALYNSSFYGRNVGLCGVPLPACIPPSPPIPNDSKSGLQWWVVMIIISGSLTLAIGSCLFATWRWRVYHKRHQQDADLIKTLMERESTSLMSLQELKKATNNFAQSAQIGEGGFGTVYIGKLNDGTLVAIKKSKREGFEKEKGQFLNEVRILSQVKHRHLVKLLGCCMANKIALLVFEFVSNGTLQQHLRKKFGKQFLSWKQRLKIAMQTAEALSYLHSAASYPIYHRDVKPSNILLNDDLDAKVADFGISKLAPIEATHVSTIAIQGTIGYLDPEYYTSYKLTEKSDVYSFGVVLLELISAKPAIDLHRGDDETSLVNFAEPYIRSGDVQEMLDPTMMETYRDPSGHGRKSILSLGRLAMKCLDMRSKARPSMNEVSNELQTLWLELTGSSKYLVSIKKVDNEERRFDHHFLRSESLPSKAFSFSSCDGSSDIEMPELSYFTS